MATETQNGIELRNSVDNTSAEAGFRELEKSADATSRRIEENRAKAAERAARAEAAAAKRSAGEARRALSIGVGIGTAAAGALGGALRASGDSGLEKAGAALEGASAGAAKLGTMLAPLGPAAMAAGAAVGAVGGALTELASASAEARRRMEEQTQSVRDASAAEESARSGPRTLEARVAEQRQAHERIDAALHAASKGATVSKDDVLFALDWDRDAAMTLLDAYEKTAGKGDSSLSDMIYAGMDYANGDRDEMMSEAAVERYENEGWMRPSWLPESLGGERHGAQNRLAAAEALGARRLRVLAGEGPGNAWDPKIEKLLARQRDAEAGERKKADREFRDRLYGRTAKDEALPGAEDAEERTEDPRAGRLLGASADSLGSRGIGYGGSPMRETEKLLREIRDDARRAARRGGGALIG